MEGVLLVELSSKTEVVLSHPPELAKSHDLAQVAAMCFPYDVVDYETCPCLTTRPPILVLTGKTGDVVGSRVFGYTRRFKAPGAHGRYDVGRPRVLAWCVLTKFSCSSLAFQLLAGLEGQTMRAPPASVVGTAHLVPPPVVSVGWLGWRGTGLIGALCRRLRNARELRKLLGAVMCERRVLFSGSDEYDVSVCVAAAAALPEIAFGADRLFWPHIVATTLTTATLPYAGSPSPYLIGVHAAKLDNVLDDCVGNFHRGDLVVVDVDNGVVTFCGTEGQEASQAVAGLNEDAALGDELKRFAKDVGLCMKRADAAHKDADRVKKSEDKKRRDVARRAKMEQLGATAARGALGAAKAANRAMRGKLFTNSSPSSSSKQAVEDDDTKEELSPRPTPPALAEPTTPGASSVGTEDDDERRFFEHYYEDEDDPAECERIDAAVLQATAALLRSLIGAARPSFVLPKNTASALDDARELFVADRVAKSPQLEPFAREFVTTQMFAGWALAGPALHNSNAPEEDEEALPPPLAATDDVVLVLRGLAKSTSAPPTRAGSGGGSWKKSFKTPRTPPPGRERQRSLSPPPQAAGDDAADEQLVAPSRNKSELDLALADYGGFSRRSPDVTPMRGALELAEALFAPPAAKDAGVRAALLRAAAVLLDDNRSRRRRKRRRLDADEKNARLAAATLALAALLRGPPSSLASLVNELVWPLGRAANDDDDDDVRDRAQTALDLCLDAKALETARDACAIADVPVPPLPSPPLNGLLAAIPTFHALHAAHNPQNAPPSSRLDLPSDIPAAPSQPAGHVDLLNFGDAPQAPAPHAPFDLLGMDVPHQAPALPPQDVFAPAVGRRPPPPPVPGGQRPPPPPLPPNANTSLPTARPRPPPPPTNLLALGDSSDDDDDDDLMSASTAWAPKSMPPPLPPRRPSSADSYDEWAALSTNQPQIPPRAAPPAAAPHDPFAATGSLLTPDFGVPGGGSLLVPDQPPAAARPPMQPDPFYYNTGSQPPSLSRPPPPPLPSGSPVSPFGAPGSPFGPGMNRPPPPPVPGSSNRPAPPPLPPAPPLPPRTG